MTTKILFIGHGLFCESLTRLLSENPSVEIIGAVNTCDEARTIFETQHPDVLIVDHAQVSLKMNDLEDLLESGQDSLKVIFLTLAENKMVVHNRQQLADVTLPVLMQALDVSTVDEEQTA
jgi:DNA-binding NarL/FixJ family response regulator